MNEYHVLDVHDPDWLPRLRRGHVAFDPKGDQFVEVEWAWEPPDPGSCAGCIGLIMLHREYDGWHTGQHVHAWYVKPDGTGFDGSQVLLPVEGHVPEVEGPIAEPWKRHVERSMAHFRHHIEQLEAYVTELGNKINEFETDRQHRA